jgi:hypothetical protein
MVIADARLGYGYISLRKHGERDGQDSATVNQNAVQLTTNTRRYIYSNIYLFPRDPPVLHTPTVSPELLMSPLATTGLIKALKAKPEASPTKTNRVQKV